MMKKSLFLLALIVVGMMAIAALADVQVTNQHVEIKHQGEEKQEDVAAAATETKEEEEEKKPDVAVEEPEDEEEEEEADVEPEVVVDEQMMAAGSGPNIRMVSIFPDTQAHEFVAGEKVHMVVGLADIDTRDMEVAWVWAALYHPQDSHYFIQNFTARHTPLNVTAGTEATLSYEFTPDSELFPRDYNLLAVVEFKLNDSYYAGVAYNGTFIILEADTSFDLQTLVTYATILAAAGAAAFAGVKMLTSFTKKPRHLTASAALLQHQHAHAVATSAVPERNEWLVGTAAYHQDKVLKTRKAIATHQKQ